MEFKSNKVKEFWKEYCNTLSETERNKWINIDVDAWSFGDSPVMADDLLAYVLSGEKTATSGMLAEYKLEDEPIPKIGERSIILNGIKEPIVVIEVTNVTLQSYKDVDEIFALKEGEGFNSLEDWREVHWNFFSRWCEKLDLPLSEDMIIVCEEFKVIYK